MFRVIPAVFVSKRNDEIPIARIIALTKAGRDFGFDTIYDLRVEGHIIVRKIDIPRGRACLRDYWPTKKQEEGPKRHIDELTGNDSYWKSWVGWGLARQVERSTSNAKGRFRVWMFCVRRSVFSYLAIEREAYGPRTHNCA
jgi:hypothetical protein